MLLFCNFLLRVEQEQNGMIIFIFSLSYPFPTYFQLKLSHNGNFEFFCFFLGSFYYALGGNGTEWNTSTILIFSLSHLFQLILVWNEAIMVFFNFLNFFAIFMEFSISRRVGTERSDNYYFPSFSALSNLFWLERKP